MSSLPVTVGIDVGGSSVKTATVRGDRLLASGRTPLRSGPALELVLDLTVELVAQHAPEALGVGLAGLVRHPSGELVWGPHLVEREVPYRERLEDRLGLPVVVENDATAAAHAEVTAGAARGARHAVVVTLGTGIGAGLVVDGRVFRGASFAGEVGHLRLDPGGRPCACGRSGCWETRLSGEVLDRWAAGLAEEEPGGLVAEAAGTGIASARHLVEAARRGDPRATRALADAGRWLGVGVAQLVLVLDPELVVVAGEVSAAGEELLGPAREAIASTLPGVAVRPPVHLVTARFGGLAGAVGAAMLASSGRRPHGVEPSPRSRAGGTSGDGRSSPAR